MKKIILIIISLWVTNVFAQQISTEDMSCVKQKHRFPLWTYYNNNTQISGISLGFGHIEVRNVTTNGIKISVPGIAAIGLFFPNFTGLMYNEDEQYRIKQEYLIANKNTREKVNGFNFGGFGNFLENTYVNGVDVNLYTSYHAQSNGISLTGLVNCLDVNNGLQFACLLSDCGVSNGVQMAIFSHSLYVKGLQIGLYNRCKNCKGVQIGLWNKNQKRSLPFVNWCLNP